MRFFGFLCYSAGGVATRSLLVPITRACVRAGAMGRCWARDALVREWQWGYGRGRLNGGEFAWGIVGQGLHWCVTGGGPGKASAL